jgi:hypothetical protein
MVAMSCDAGANAMDVALEISLSCNSLAASLEVAGSLRSGYVQSMVLHRSSTVATEAQSSIKATAILVLAVSPTSLKDSQLKTRRGSSDHR